MYMFHSEKKAAHLLFAVGVLVLRVEERGLGPGPAFHSAERHAELLRDDRAHLRLAVLALAPPHAGARALPHLLRVLDLQPQREKRVKNSVTAGGKQKRSLDSELSQPKALYARGIASLPLYPKSPLSENHNKGGQAPTWMRAFLAWPRRTASRTCEDPSVIM